MDKMTFVTAYWNYRQADDLPQAKEIIMARIKVQNAYASGDGREGSWTAIQFSGLAEGMKFDEATVKALSLLDVEFFASKDGSVKTYMLKSKRSFTEVPTKSVRELVDDVVAKAIPVYRRGFGDNPAKEDAAKDAPKNVYTAKK
jgi:hypothetical protein